MRSSQLSALSSKLGALGACLAAWCFSSGCAQQDNVAITTKPSSEEMPVLRQVEHVSQATVAVEGGPVQTESRLVPDFKLPELTAEEKAALGPERARFKFLLYNELSLPAGSTLAPWYGGVTSAMIGPAVSQAFDRKSGRRRDGQGRYDGLRGQMHRTSPALTSRAIDHVRQAQVRGQRGTDPSPAGSQRANRIRHQPSEESGPAVVSGHASAIIPEQGRRQSGECLYRVAVLQLRERHGQAKSHCRQDQTSQDDAQKCATQKDHPQENRPRREARQTRR
jgi:hypothetical protein